MMPTVRSVLSALLSSDDMNRSGLSLTKLSGLFTAMVTIDRVSVTEQARMAMMIHGQRCLYQGLEAFAAGMASSLI